MCVFSICFFKQKTAYETRISDWSSDVCSSELRLDQPVLNRRQRDLCRQAHGELAGIIGDSDPLIVAERLRRARTALDRITGAAGTEAMLDALFSRFCIGK